MGLVEEQSLSLALANEKEGGTVVVTTNPVDDRIVDPKSKSKTETTNKTKPKQSKPNKTSFPLNIKFSAISYWIFIKIGMVISITLWHINMQNL